MTNPFYNPATFLLPADLEKELFQQTVELIAYVNGNSGLSDSKYVQLKQMYLDALYKYQDVQKISYEAAEQLVKEAGYDYLLSIFVLTEDKLKILVSYLPLIQQMKGTRPGLQLIFDILSIGFTITEWWEDPNNLEVLSYILSVEIINQPATTDVVQNLITLSRNYVYPLLTKIVYSLLYKLNPTPVIGSASQIKNSLEIRQTVPWLTWDTDAEADELWSTDMAPTDWQNSEYPEMLWASESEVANESNTWPTEDNLNSWEKPSLADIGLDWWEARISTDTAYPERNWTTDDTPTYWS